MRTLVVLVLAVGVVFVAGCGGEETSVNEETRYVTEMVTVSEQETTKETTPTGDPITASGRGSDSLTVDLTPGLATFTYSYQGAGQPPGYFGVELLDGSGRPVGLIANGVGTTKGAKSVRIPRQGTYAINVTANQGSWTLTGPPRTE